MISAAQCIICLMTVLFHVIVQLGCILHVLCVVAWLCS